MSKLLININNLNEIEEYKKVGITNFLFAIPEFSHTYKKFNLDEIPEDSYILMNRLLDTKDVEKLRNNKNLYIKFKGIIFEDISVYQIFKDTSLELIWNQVHFATNSSSINFWLDRVNSCILSNEITKEEIETIISKVNKPIILNVFGKNNIMYSRRTLLTNFNKYNNLELNTKMTINTNNDSFDVYEESTGTFVYNKEYFNYLNKLDIDDSKIKYYYINNLDYSVDEIKSILDGLNIGNDGFLNKKTVYKLEDYPPIKGGNKNE